MQPIPFALSCFLLSCLSAQDRSFGDVWYRGEAEVARYELEIERYGEMRDGHAVLVFVTEPFLPDAQVKADRGDPAERGAVTVLKLNRIERFVTGIYDYSMMQSVFTPCDRAAPARALKVTTSVQDWCGHVWLQLNRREDGVEVTGHSYFEAEGEEQRTLAGVRLEDGIWTALRIAPERLPTGEIEIVPGSFDARLRHVPLEARTATARRTRVPADGEDPERLRYELDYGDRRIAWTVTAVVPHELLHWREELGREGNRRVVSEARRTHVTWTPYWQHNAETDTPMRRELGLPDGTTHGDGPR